MAEANIINAVKIDGVNYAIANDDRYYTEAEIDGKLNVRPVWDSPNDAVNGGVMVCDSTYGNIKCAGNYVKSVNGSTGTVTISNATTSANGLMSASDKAKLDNTNVAYGTCGTAANTAAKTVSLSGNTNWQLKNGSIIMVSFTNSNTAEGVTINVNNTGAYPIWYNNSEYTGTGNAYTGYAGRVTTYMFNGTHWVWVSNSYDANTQSNTNSTDTSSKIYLVGATSQGSNKTTYSHSEVYVGTDHHVYSNGNQVVNLSDSQTLSNKVYNGQYIELYPGSSAGHGGYIDFHYNNSKSDYTSRIIEQSSGTLNIQSTNFQHNGLKVLTDGIIVDSYNVAVKFTNGVAKYSNSNIKANAVVMVSRRGNVAGANTSYCTHTNSGGGSVTICCSSSVNETHYLNIIISNI